MEKEQKIEKPFDFTIELSKNRKLSISKYYKNVLIDIREYYEENGQMKPGKKGISISKEQWDVIKKNMGNIDDAIQALMNSGSV
jgi:hypothetical protein